MGAAYKNHCYSTQAQALDAYYSAAPVFLTAGDTDYLSQISKIEGNWYVVRYTINSGVTSAPSASFAPSPIFPDCEPLEAYLDGVTIGWGLAAAMIGAAMFRIIQKAIS